MGQNGKMMPLAMIMSLPRAAFNWSSILLAAQALVILLFTTFRAIIPGLILLVIFVLAFVTRVILVLLSGLTVQMVQIRVLRLFHVLLVLGW